MQSKKKSMNRQSLKIKRVPLGNIPSLNCTQQIRIPTLSSTQLKGIVRSIDLRKLPISNPYKKNISRKSTCKSVKQNLNYQPPKLKTMMKQFKELKILHQNQRSKSKSPVSCKSKSLEKLIPKKLSYKTLKTKPASEVNLAVKLEKTIKKLNQTDFFKEEDSLLPLKSSSDLVSDRKQNQHLITEKDQLINIDEVRQFCSTGSIQRHKDKNLAFKSYTSFKETMSAVKIQRAWRRFQTKKLVQRYVFFLQHQEDNAYVSAQMHQSMKSPSFQSLSEHQNYEHSQQREQLVVAPESFYKQKAERSKVRHISNLQQQVQSVSQDYQQVVKMMKAEQLQKWNQIISIISASKTDNPQQLQKLLQRLAQQSQMNKKQLEEKTNLLNSASDKKKRFPLRQQEKIDVSQHGEQLPKSVQGRKCKNKSGSISSQALEEYDSKKYIQYLDGDLFAPEDNQQKSSQRSSEYAIKTSLISKRKQQILLQQLKIQSIPIKLGQSALYRSQSLKGLELALTKQDMRSKSRQGLKKSTSQKVLRRALLDFDQQDFDLYEEQINLDLLTRQFLEGTDPNSDSLDMVYSQQRLKNKLAELNKLKDSQLNNEFVEQNLHQDIFQSDQDDEPLPYQNSNILKRSHPFKVPHPESIKPQIKIEEGEQSPKMTIQVVAEEIKSDSGQEIDKQEQNQKSQTIATIIINNLILQVLKQISKSDTVSSSFKNYCLSLKPRVRRAEGTKKKKGFATNKAQIQLFMDSLLKYLKKQQPDVFKNLEIATGPSAIQMLRYMHQFGEQQSEIQQQQDQPNVMVIPNRVFDSFWQIKQKAIVIQVPENYDQTNSAIFKHQFQVLKSFNKIFYRSLFDTFNQCLDHQRNFGLYGKPFPWKQVALFDHKNSEQKVEIHLKNAQKKMMQLSTTYCGLIVEKEQMASISQQYIKQVHEDRLSRMLASDLIEAEQRWVFYDDQETQILVEIAGSVYTEIIIEVIEELYQFQ